jgi:FAD/FMN-containing dehydrogenase
MGGQQFCDGGLLLDMRPMNRVLGLDRERGLVEVEAGIQWPDLISELDRIQGTERSRWGIAQKQTGADRMTIGGAVAANVHGRGLGMPPFVADVEALTIVAADGRELVCDRERNAELFRLVVGGYGLFGCVISVTMRLVRRRVLERIVELESIERLAARFEERIGEGYLYGDFQFATDESSDLFLRAGVFSCYRPSDREINETEPQLALSRGDWTRLIALAHTGKAQAFDEYSRYYLSTSGQLYHSDTHQLADYEDGYHDRLDVVLGRPVKGTEMISELYVPREHLADFMSDAAAALRHHRADVIYGTIRLVEQDHESFLAWAREPWACVIFNLHTDHTVDGIERSTRAFRSLIDLAADRGGTYFLTYHRWATRSQVERCHPRLSKLLQLKLQHDPGGLFQSDWYRHHRALLTDAG